MLGGGLEGLRFGVWSSGFGVWVRSSAFTFRSDGSVFCLLGVRSLAVVAGRKLNIGFTAPTERTPRGSADNGPSGRGSCGHARRIEAIADWNCSGNFFGTCGKRVPT
jgi:hypothetical protein